MRRWWVMRKKILWFIVSTIIFLLIYKYRSSTSSSRIAERNLPLLTKSYIRKGENVLLGPFFSDTKPRPTTSHGVTFVTQTSLHNLYRLQILELIWKSPISVAVWASGDVTKLVELCYLLTLACSNFSQLTISILLPANQPVQVDVANIDWDTILHPSRDTCSQKNLHNRLYALRAQDRRENYVSTTPYPNNRLRNIALSEAETQYVLVADMDLLPSVETEDRLMKYLHENGVAERTALVIPVFESENIQINQWSMNRLLEGWNSAKVRQFYIETCPQCQGATQYSSWIEHQSPAGLGPIETKLLLYQPGWEPFVLLDRVRHPLFDERFVQFGYNRMSLICDLHMSGYSFYSLDGVFLMHDGFKTEGGFHAEKDRELKRNEELYLQFREELSRKYKTKKTC